MLHLNESQLQYTNSTNDTNRRNSSSKGLSAVAPDDRWIWSTGVQNDTGKSNARRRTNARA